MAMYRNVVLLSVVYHLLLVVPTPGISAHEEPKAVALYKRQTTPAPSQSTATYTNTSSSPTTTPLPNEISEAVNITLDGHIFPPNIQIEGLSGTSIDLTRSTDLTINCVNCTVTGDFSLSAGVGDSKIAVSSSKPPPDVKQRANSSDFNFKDIWAAATVDNLNATFEFGVNFKASNTTKEFLVPVFSQTKSSKFDIFALTATLKADIHGWVNTSSDVNFTYGFEFGVPPYSELLIDLADPTKSTSLGFNETRLAPIPFNSIRSDIDMDIELSFRPSITLVLSNIGKKIFGGSLTLDVGLDVPKFEVGIKQVHHVSSSCNPAPASLPPDQIYQNLTLVSPKLGFGLSEKFEGELNFLGHKLSAGQPFEQNFPHDLAPTCLFYDADKQGLAPAPVVNPLISQPLQALMPRSRRLSRRLR